MVACRNQQSGSNPTRARFIHNRVEFFFPLYTLCFYDNKNIFYKAVILNWTLQKNHKNDREAVGFYN